MLSDASGYLLRDADLPFRGLRRRACPVTDLKIDAYPWRRHYTIRQGLGLPEIVEQAYVWWRS